MEAVAEEVRSQVDDRPFLSDPYLDWAEAQNIPIVEDFGIHLPDLPVSPWEHFECNGGLAHLKGRGDWLSVFVLELPPAVIRGLATICLRKCTTSYRAQGALR